MLVQASQGVLSGIDLDRMSGYAVSTSPFLPEELPVFIFPVTDSLLILLTKEIDRYPIDLGASFLYGFGDVRLRDVPVIGDVGEKVRESNPDLFIHPIPIDRTLTTQVNISAVLPYFRFFDLVGSPGEELSSVIDESLDKVFLNIREEQVFLREVEIGFAFEASHNEGSDDERSGV